MSQDPSAMPLPLKILLHYPVLNSGGAERSTLRLLSALADRGCDVHLVLSVGGGQLESEIDSRVTVYHLRDTVGNFPAEIHSIRDAWRFAIGAIQWGWGRVQQAWRSRRFAAVSFDVAIAGLHGLSPGFICERVQARRRFVMVRNDAADDRLGKLARNIVRYQDRIDAYICVSQSVLDSLVALYPEVARKAVRVYNLIDPESMRKGAAVGADPFAQEPPGLRVLTVCRLQESQKALLRMVEVHQRLLDAGLPHVWHVLGDGPDRAMLESAIEKRGVSESFRLHGSIGNPFPYYKHADICAVFSRYEGLCGVVNEARVLERPVIATRFAGIEEQIDSGVNGLIVEQDVDAICAGLASLIRDAGLRERLARGGYPRELLDDQAKVDALMQLMGDDSRSSTSST